MGKTGEKAIGIYDGMILTKKAELEKYLLDYMDVFIPYYRLKKELLELEEKRANAIAQKHLTPTTNQ